MSLAGAAVTDALFSAVLGLTGGSYAWRLVLMCVHEVTFGLGAAGIPWFWASEVFQVALRSAAMAVIGTLNWVLAYGMFFLQALLLSDAGDKGNMGAKYWGTFAGCAVVSGIGAAVGFFYVRNPERQARKAQILHSDVYEELNQSFHTAYTDSTYDLRWRSASSVS
jgi:hypothetical protein